MNFGIIAAGEGSRLAQEGVEVPKPLVRIEGKPMIHRLIDIYMANGAEKICVIVNARMPEVAEYLEKLRPQLEVPLEMVVKTTPSSMHSFYEIGKLLRGHGRFVATTVDTIFRPEDFGRYVEAFRDSAPEVDGMMAMTSFVDDEKPLWIEAAPVSDSVSEYEDGRRAADRILAFRDTSWDDARYVSGGIYGLSDSALDVLDDCLERGVARMRNFQRALIGAGLDIRGYDMGKILDVDHAGDIVKAEDFLRNH